MQNHVMFDIETLGTVAGCAVIQIGAVRFDRNFKVLDTFLVNIHPKESAELGFTADPDTIEWWKKQSEEARLSVCIDSMNPLKAFKSFTDWVPKDSIGWCHNNFDSPILEFAFKKTRVLYPFHYTKVCDMRTMQNLAGIDTKTAQRMFKREGTHHNALDDSMFQVKVLEECVRNLGINLP